MPPTPPLKTLSRDSTHIPSVIDTVNALVQLVNDQQLVIESLTHTLVQLVNESLTDNAQGSEVALRGKKSTHGKT